MAMSDEAQRRYWIDGRHLDEARLDAYAERLRSAPFDFLVIDDFLRPDRLAALMDALGRDGRLEARHGLMDRTERVTEQEWEEAAPERRFYRHRELAGPKPGHELSPGYVSHLRFVKALHTDALRAFFTRLTGVAYASTDNVFAKALGPDDFLRPHSDNAPGRKLCLVLYLSQAWRAEWGGAFQLFDRTGTQVAAIEPQSNRLLVFEPVAEWLHSVAPVVAGVERYNYSIWFS